MDGYVPFEELKIELDADDNVVAVASRSPQVCTRCGAMVGDETIHDRWHNVRGF